MKKTLKVIVTKLFGERIVLPDDDISKVICNAAGLRSMTNALIKQLKKEGYEIMETVQ